MPTSARHGPVRTGPTVVVQSSLASFLDWLSPVLPSQGLGKTAVLEAQVTSLPLPIFFHPPNPATAPPAPPSHVATPSSHPRPTPLIPSHGYNIYSLPGNGILDYRRQDMQGNLFSSLVATSKFDRGYGQTWRRRFHCERVPPNCIYFLEKKKNRSSHVWIPANGQGVVVDRKVR